jgi:hypothetical protein
MRGPSDKGCGSAIGNSLHQHSLSGTRRAVEKDTARRVDTDLVVEVEVCKGQLDSFSDFLLLHVQSSDISVRNVWLLVCTKHSNGGVCLWGKDVDERV